MSIVQPTSVLLLCAVKKPSIEWRCTYTCGKLYPTLHRGHLGVGWGESVLNLWPGTWLLLDSQRGLSVWPEARHVRVLARVRWGEGGRNKSIISLS